MELDKLQRHTAYIIMLAEIESPSPVAYRNEFRMSTENGLCWLYKMLFDWNFDYHFELLLPELNRYKNAIWWSSCHPVDWEVRKCALQQCINETYES